MMHLVSNNGVGPFKEVNNDGNNDGLDDDGDKNNTAMFHLLTSTLLFVVVRVFCCFGYQRKKEHK